MEINDTLTGVKRRYHIDRRVSAAPQTEAYSAFSRRRSGRGLKRRYYALLAFPAGLPAEALHAQLRTAFAMLPYHARIEEEIALRDRHVVVVARGNESSPRSSRWRRLQNRGYLMLLLSALLLLLIIIRL